MENYIKQLIELLKIAHDSRPTPSYLELPEEMETLRDVIELEKSLKENEQTMESIFGIPQINFPPEKRLTDEQLKLLKDAIIDLWRAFNYEADFRKGEFDERQQYTKLVEKWKASAPVYRGTNGTWHIEMLDYEDEWEEDDF